MRDPNEYYADQNDAEQIALIADEEAYLSRVNTLMTYRTYDPVALAETLECIGFDALAQRLSSLFAGMERGVPVVIEAALDCLKKDVTAKAKEIAKREANNPVLPVMNELPAFLQKAS